jgi:uncharacterized protein Yka (UPF0111/DUF47 family)
MNILPGDVKQQYKKSYQDLYERWQLDQLEFSVDSNESDPNNFRAVAKNQIIQVINMLDSPAPDNSQQLYQQLVQHLNRWDPVYKLNARELYPELKDILDRHGYNV